FCHLLCSVLFVESAVHFILELPDEEGGRITEQKEQHGDDCQRFDVCPGVGTVCPSQAQYADHADRRCERHFLEQDDQIVAEHRYGRGERLREHNFHPCIFFGEIQCFCSFPLSFVDTFYTRTVNFRYIGREMDAEGDHRCDERSERCPDIRDHRPGKVQEEYLYKRRCRPDELTDPVDHEIEWPDRCRLQGEPDEAGCNGQCIACESQAECNVYPFYDERECINECFPAPHQPATPFFATFSPFLDSHISGSAMRK